MDEIRIVVAAHKPYWMPDDPMYLPLQVGREGKPDFGFTGDDTGDNISGRNPHYCELTGLYWAWKNLDAAWIGLVHYRRHFSGGRGGDRKARVITGAEMREALSRCDVLVPKARQYWIETNYSQYAHAHHAADLDMTRNILAERDPACLTAFDAVMKRTRGHRFNMLVMSREKLDAYCSWLFGVLFELERRLDISSYSPKDARVFGYVGERLLDVWLEANAIAYRELPCVFLERQNWPVKGTAFVMRKLRAGKHSKKG